MPIVLHLIKREHARKIEFPSLMFLRRISKKTIRYQKLRHLLLLLLRVLAFLLIVLTFMRPYREKAQAAAGVGRVRSAHIILLDHSLSMGYQDRWSRARKAAADIVKSAGSGDKFAVLQFSDRTLARTQLTADSSEALRQIESLELSDQATRYGQALRAAEKFALEAGTEKRIIHLVSDFQKNGWMAEDQDYRLGAGIELNPVDVGSEEFSNLRIRDVRVLEPEQETAGMAGINASVTNFGGLDRKNARVSLLLDGRMAGEKRIDIAAGASQGVEFQLPGLSSGLHRVILEVEDSYLARDNRFYLTVEARGKTPVMVVEGRSPGGRRSPSFFLSRALNIEELSPYKVNIVSPQSLAISGGLLIWNDAPGGTAAVQKKVQDYVKGGGGLAVILGESARPDDFNRSFGSWLPVKMEAPAGFPLRRPAENYVLMTDVRADHPIFRPFSQPHSGSFSSARFYKHARISAGPGIEVPARFDNGDPALVTMHSGKGRVLIFASSADDSLNDLPLKAVYAPFWQQVLHYLEDFQERRPWLEVGETLSPRKVLADAAMRQGAVSADPDQPVAVLDPGRLRLAIAPGTDNIAVEKSGFYEIRSASFNASIAVNASSHESDLTHGDAEAMAAGWSSSPSAVLPPGDRPEPEDQDRRQRIWVLLLAAAALFLVAELFLSNDRFRTTDEA